MSDSIYFDSDDAMRIDRTVRHFEDQVQGQVSTGQRRQFFDLPVLKLYLIKESAGLPESLDDSVAVKAQPFEGDTSPQLAYEEDLDEDGKPVPKLETIYHSLPGVRLCPGTLAWCVYAYSQWRIVYFEQWPVSVQQIDAEGFPSGTVACNLVIDDVTLSFDLSTDATTEQLLDLVRVHEKITDPTDVQAIGGPLTYCAINLMFGPGLTGKNVQPLQIDNLGQPLGKGLRLRLLTPLWAVS
ncbi:hypothetical protein [Rubinisphaera sp.]|uniref:hypothetical protein n=1 Tax=Rubinisphaera sp. TaxID=2024857 RepID=UPI000C0EEBE6|nr:hypothetical protein [Rubinisphaera sp.]MBV07810.1 hypothetical protein [Rubinisphaera sp.]HCS53174.1 hypothetical protein [Planctomycetaceae bacterium]|tara:strand:- start:2317 stop:3036 length:720 start_codon:yes stop_codon:yes gene_type:complete